MLKRGLFFLIGLLVVLGLFTPVAAQEKPVIYAAVVDGNILIYGLSDTPQPVFADPSLYQEFSQLTWLPDGRLAFVATDVNYNRNLMLASMDGSEPVWIGQVNALMPLTYFAQAGSLVFTPRDQMGTVASISPMPGQYEIPFSQTYQFGGGGCGGGSSLPQHWAEWKETEIGPGGSPLVQMVVPDGIVHSTDCTGYGTALLDMGTGQDTVLGDRLGWVQVSPDGRQLVGISGRQLGLTYVPGTPVLIDLATKTVTPLNTVANPEIFAWSASGAMLYYTTRTETGQFPADPAQQVTFSTLMMGTTDPYYIPDNTVTIHQYMVATGADNEIYSGNAYAIGRLFAAPDDSSLVFSTISNAGPFVEAALAAGGDYWDGAGVDLVTVDLWQLNLADGSVTQIGANVPVAEPYFAQ